MCSLSSHTSIALTIDGTVTFQPGKVFRRQRPLHHLQVWGESPLWRGSADWLRQRRGEQRQTDQARPKTGASHTGRGTAVDASASGRQRIERAGEFTQQAQPAAQAATKPITPRGRWSISASKRQPQDLTDADQDCHPGKVGS